MSQIREILPGTAIVATALGSTSIRLYFQDSFDSIREFAYESGWTGGSLQQIKFQAKSLSPLAALEWTGNHIRIYLLDRQNIIREQCYEPNQGWSVSTPGERPTVTVEWSKLACTAWSSSGIRVYYQMEDQSIQELCYGDGRWTNGHNLPGAVAHQPYAGTNITSISWDEGTRVRTYTQDEDNTIWEHGYSQESRSWYSKSLEYSARPYTPLVSVTWNDGRRHIRIYSFDAYNKIQELCFDDGYDWNIGSLTKNNIQASPLSKLAAIYSDQKIRLYFQPIDNDTIQEYGVDFGGSWFKGHTLAATPDGSKAIDVNGATYRVGLLPWIGDLKSWRNYNPSEINGVGILVGYENGKLIGEDLMTRKSTVLAPNTAGNSYTWVYTPDGAIIYRRWDQDHAADYIRHSQLGSGNPVICAGEFRLATNAWVETVLVMINDASGHYKPQGSQCLFPVAAKFESLGIPLDQTRWLWKS